MSVNGKERFILTKSYEIAYALFRVAGVLQEKDFAERLRASGAAILEAASRADYSASHKALQTIECFVKFAGDVNFITLANSDSLLREVYLLDAAIAERMRSAQHADINLAEIFSEANAPAGQEEVSNAAMPEKHFSAPYAHRQSGNRTSSELESEPVPNGFMRADVRQSAILDKIRQSGNCRLKDIQEILPNCSERTIRYDLQSLLEKSLIERIGTGGPAVFYRMRQEVAPSQG